ncbi:MAG TPA: hypothetical protein VIH21_06820 [Dehalococcoidia bacterium]
MPVVERTVDELMRAFHDALVNIIPPLERASIAWQAPDAYDDWDEITETLFNVMVMRTISYTVVGEGNALAAPRYGFSYDSYAEFSFVSLDASPVADEHYAFVKFEANVPSLPVASCVEADGSGSVVRQVSLPIDDGVFKFQHRTSPEELRTISELRFEQ